MSEIKNLIIERENTIINLIHRVDCVTEKVDEDTANEIWDAWVENSLPLDEDMDELRYIAMDDEEYEYVVNTAEGFLKSIEGNN